MIWINDAIFMCVLKHLTDNYKHIRVIIGMHISDRDEVRICFSGELYETMAVIPGQTINKSIIQHARDHRKETPEVIQFIPAADNILEWLYQYYRLFLHAEAEPKQKKKQDDFTGGYKTYEGERGNKEQWQRTADETFEQDFFREFHSGKSKGGKNAFEDFFSQQHAQDAFWEQMFGKAGSTGPKAGQQQQQRPNTNTTDDFFSRRGGPTTQQCAAILGITIPTTEEIIKSAWKKLVKIWHPDLNAHRLEEAKVMMQKINIAYAKLKG